MGVAKIFIDEKNFFGKKLCIEAAINEKVKWREREQHLGIIKLRPARIATQVIQPGLR